MDPFIARALLFVERWSTVIYIVGAVALVIYLIRARNATQRRARSPFQIEREEASILLRDALAIILIVLAILATTFYIDRVLIGNREEESRLRTTALAAALASPTSLIIGVLPTKLPTETSTAPPAATDTPMPTPTASGTADPDASPTGSPTGAARTATTGPPRTATVVNGQPPKATPIATQPPPPTAIPTAAPPPTPAPPPTAPPPTAVPPPTEPPAPAVPNASCPTAGVQIGYPSNGAVVSGSVTVSGTAAIQDFQFYKVEVAPNQSGSFSSIGDVIRTPVSGGPLVTWNSSAYPTGLWALRLTVVDNSGNFPPPCTIYVVSR